MFKKKNIINFFDNFIFDFRFSKNSLILKNTRENNMKKFF